MKDASRTALGVLILSSLSFHVYRMHWSSEKVASHFAEAFQWSAITVVLVSAPVVGRVARTGLERILGTILGAAVAYLACLAAAPALLTVMAALMALTGLAWGAHLGYEYSGKLLSITFLIVAPVGLKEGSGLHVALSRAGGIIVGILLTFLLSCSWFPRSASGQVVDHLHNSLQALHQLTALTWSGLIPHCTTQGESSDEAASATAAAAAAAADESAAVPGHLAAGVVHALHTEYVEHRAAQEQQQQQHQQMQAHHAHTTASADTPEQPHSFSCVVDVAALPLPASAAAAAAEAAEAIFLPSGTADSRDPETQPPAAAAAAATATAGSGGKDTSTVRKIVSLTDLRDLGTTPELVLAAAEGVRLETPAAASTQCAGSVIDWLQQGTAAEQHQQRQGQKHQQQQPTLQQPSFSWFWQQQQRQQQQQQPSVSHTVQQQQQPSVTPDDVLSMLGTVLSGAAAAAMPLSAAARAAAALSEDQRLELRRRIDDQCEDALFRCTQQALAAGDALKTAESELYAGTAWGYRLYLPLLLLGKRSRRRFHLPRDLVAQLRLCVRRLARITWSLHTIIQEGFDAQMMAVVAQRYPPELLQQLQDASTAFVGDVLGALPPGSSCLDPAAAAAAAGAGASKVPQHNLLRFQQALHTLQEISEMQRMQLIDHIRRYNQPPPPPSHLNLHSSSSSRGGSSSISSSSSRSARFSFAEPAVIEAAATAAATAATAAAVGDLEAMPAGADAGAADPGTADRQASVKLGASCYLVEDMSAQLPRLKVPPAAAAAAIAQPHVDTPRLFFADTSEGYLAKLRWYSFQFLLEQLAEGYAELADTMNSMLLLLPGAEPWLAGQQQQQQQ